MTFSDKDYSKFYKEEVDSPSIDPDKDEAKGDQQQSARFNLIPFDEITIGSESSYLVKGIIPRSGLTVVWGPPKCGKSFWVFDLVMHVVLCRDYRGHRVHGGPVVYLALEGSKGFRARAEGFRKYPLGDHTGPVPFYLVGTSIDLIKEHPELIACIRSQMHGDVPAAVVIDTLNRSLAGSESSDTDMSAYVQAADQIRDAFGCAVIVVHHCGHDASRPRGHTSLMGAADGQISVRRDAAKNIVAQVQWLKDGEEGEPILSRLEQVDVGTDEDGDPITTCIVAQVEGEPVEADTRKRGADRDILAMEALTEALLAHGQPLPASSKFPHGMRGCKLDQWRKELYARSIVDHHEKFSRLHHRLRKNGMIAVYDEWVWAIKPEGSAKFTPDI